MAAAAETIDDDFDIAPSADPQGTPLDKDATCLAKVAARAEQYKPRMIFTPRPGKRLLVLDIDYTIFDHRSTAESAMELARPHLHTFLQRAYVDYDLVFWSATSMRWIVLKLTVRALSTRFQPARVAAAW